MQRTLASLTALVFAFLVLGLSVKSAQLSLVMTVEGINEGVEQKVQEGADQELAVSEDEGYELVYPGLMPDHPLYLLKMIRDQIQLLVTKDSSAKAQLMLVNADKRIAASLILAERGKLGLAASTATKAEQYLQRAIAEAGKIGDEAGRRNFYERAKRANGKHGMILLGIASRLPEDGKASLQEAYKSNAGSREQLIGEMKE